MTTSGITMSSNSSLRIKELTSLRGLFMITIFLHHLGLYEGGANMAVTFFFVLSGFSLSLGYYNRIINHEFSYKSFVMRRFARLYPVHWLCFLIVLPLSLLGLIHGSDSMVTFMSKLVPNLCLFQSLIPVMDIYFSFNAVSWYISDIIIMAMLFPMIIKLLIKSSMMKRVALLLFLIIIYLFAANTIPTDWHHALLYINPCFRILDFMIGVLLGLIFIRWNSKILEKKQQVYPITHQKMSYILIGLISFTVMIWISIVNDTETPYTIAVFYWLPVCLLIFSVSAISSLGGAVLLIRKSLVYLGEISLSFFMFHQIVIRYASIINSRLFHSNDLTHPFHVTVIFLIVVLVSHCSNKYFEKPIAKWLTRK